MAAWVKPRSRQAYEAWLLRAAVVQRERFLAEGWHISTQPQDQITQSSPDTSVEHLVTYDRVGREGEGKPYREIAFTICLIQRPAPVCPCGQLQVAWRDEVP